ncbi:MAG: NTP transferase domain-containing protein [Candidatus Cloacimonetes bacterium]|nr:NTP transferase domain-containing protein [Candidatus Cloacimonadota bacterium]
MKKIIKGVIPAAGFGTRMRSLSQNIPKEMLPICKKPIIEYAIKDMIKSDIREIAIITHPEKTIMNDYISEFIKKESQNKPNTPEIYFINQTKRRGLAHAIYLAKDFIGQQPFAIFLPDNLVMTNMSKKNIYQPLTWTSQNQTGNINLL